VEILDKANLQDRMLMENLLYEWNPSHADFMLHMQEIWKKKEWRRSQTASALFSQCLVSDGRDRVYAFLGLAHPEYRIIVDYTKSLEDVFRYTCKRIILFERSLDVLRYVQDPDPTMRHNLPSWTPDWPSRPAPFAMFWPGQINSNPFRASDDASADAWFGPNAMGMLNSVLRIQCLVIDRLADEDSLGVVHRAAGENLRESTILDWQKIAKIKGDDDYFNGEIWLDVFRETLSHGLNITRIVEDKENDDLFPNKHDRYVAQGRPKVLNESISGDWIFFCSPKRYMGITHCKARHNDVICILLGASVGNQVRQHRSCG